MASPPKQLHPLSLQERDIELLRGLFECRVMTAEHISVLYFGNHREATKKRLQKFKAAGLIAERSRRAFEPAALYLARNGLSVLRERGVLSEYPSFDMPTLERRARVSQLTIAHELEIVGVKTAFHVAASKTGAQPFTIAEFSTWPLLNEFTAFRPDGCEALMRPDGFIRLHEKEANNGLSEHTFFLEVDRSTETLDTLAAKAVCYIDYYKSGGFAERNGGRRAAYKDFPFRVLMVFKTAERRNNMAERLLKNSPPIFTQVYLSTLAEARSDPLGAIWIRPLDYRDATKGTPFATEQQRTQPGYQRQTARDVFVEMSVRKQVLLI
jgi:hypothetical protein